MAFKDLTVDRLEHVAEFFAKDVEVANPEKGPTKKELLAALAASSDDSEPVSWEQYETLYLAAHPNVKDEELSAVAQQKKEALLRAQEEADKEAAKEVEEEPIILKMERANPHFEIYGYTFTQDHPYRPVTEKAAEFILKHEEGFRIALPSEVTNYYN